MELVEPKIHFTVKCNICFGLIMTSEMFNRRLGKTNTTNYF